MSEEENLVLRMLVEMRAEAAALRREMKEGFEAIRGEMNDGFAKVDARFAKVDLQLADLRGLTMKTWNEVRGSTRLALAEQVATMRVEIDALNAAVFPPK